MSQGVARSVLCHAGLLLCVMAKALRHDRTALNAWISGLDLDLLCRLLGFSLLAGLSAFGPKRTTVDFGLRWFVR